MWEMMNYRVMVEPSGSDREILARIGKNGSKKSVQNKPYYRLRESMYEINNFKR